MQIGDFQQLYWIGEIVVGAFVAGVSGALAAGRMVRGMVDELESQMDERFRNADLAIQASAGATKMAHEQLSKDLHEHEIHVAENYVPTARFVDEMKEVRKSMDRLTDTINRALLGGRGGASSN